MKKIYKSKILLFGEYSVIQGHDALAIPSNLFSGFWDFDKDLANSQGILYDFYQYLVSLPFEQVRFKSDKFKNDLDHFLIFRSNIPIGYGVGSSGAVCAAIFDGYFQKETDLEIAELKQILGKIESFFHGASSGLDPLVCYLDQAILLQETQSKPIIPATSVSDFGLFLLDTGQARRTAPLVEAYLAKHASNPTFQQFIAQELSPLNHRLIQQYLAGDREALWNSFDQLSHVQWQHFQEMIPAAVHAIWQEGLLANQFRLKLCGAGGGGFMLGMLSTPTMMLELPFKTYQL